MVAAEAPSEPHHIPGYTGFLPGGQHQMAKTYGQASAATLSERQANGDPLKWRKFVSYAEFTPPHTPAEGHHIPGYSGHVPGVYAENLYAKTYGKTTLKAVSGEFPKGAEQEPDEQYKTTNQIHLGDSIPHPGRPTDIMTGGASWSGASPYNQAQGPTELQPVNPWPPSVVQIAGGKEPTQKSTILKNFPPTGETKEPALRITGKADPHDPIEPSKKTMSKTAGNFQIPGYSGFVPGVQSENLFAGTYAKTTSEADEIRDRKKPDETYLKTDHINRDGILPLKAEAPPRLRTSEMPTTATDGPGVHAKHVPGYTGFVPGVQAENIFGKTYGHSSHMAIAGDHTRFQWSEQTPEERFQSSARGELLDFGHPAKIEDGHVTYAHETTNPARANYKAEKPPITNTFDYHIPGYGGFVPGVQSKNMYAMTQYKATNEALSQYYDRMGMYDSQKPKTAPPGPLTPEGAELGMLQFKPNGFLYQKRMQGEWNNGMLGARNYSAVRLAEGRHWKGNLYKTTSKELHKGHSNADVPHAFSKGPAPTFENMDHALKHKSVYLGFYSL